MRGKTIHKDAVPGVPPNLADYEKARAGFTWSQARSELAGLPGGGLNMAHEAVDRHVAQGRGDRVALCCIARDNAVSTVTYAELAVRITLRRPSAITRHRPRRPGVHPARTLSRAVHGCAGHVEEHQRAVSALLRVRP
ncbi:hypothetical protein [Streptomyces sp. NPDC019539]|uniref:hypothetical protein n=1 Tax=Streptomyces sp. NPDC019539 TaxID=3365063 RepID=UPI0037BD0F60